MPRKNPAAVALGRMGGKVKSEKKAQAVRENGKRGGRPLKTVTVGIGPGEKIEIHHEVTWVGYTSLGEPAFAPQTEAAAKWLKRQGYERAKWQLREVFDSLESEYTWA